MGIFTKRIQILESNNVPEELEDLKDLYNFIMEEIKLHNTESINNSQESKNFQPRNIVYREKKKKLPMSFNELFIYEQNKI